MTKRFSCIVLLSCTLCAGQSTIATPANSAQTPSSVYGEATQSSPALTDDQGETSTQSLPSSRAHRGQTSSKSKSSEASKAKTEKEEKKTDADADDDASESSKKLSTIVRSDFEKFVEDATGRRIPVYGRQLFDGVSSTFAPIDHVPVPADYAIGPGDELLIRAWGKIDLDVSVTVDRNGQINLPKVGPVNVAGLRYEELNSYLHNAIGFIYKDFELNVAMGQLRSIQIFVLGNSRQPGVYTVSSLSTLIDALFASGGPSATGTMRHIQLRRGDRVITELDLYDVLRKGDKSRDVQLLPKDVIFIPTIGPQVAIVGSVNEPGIFELKSETSVSLALEAAGGLTNLATTERAMLERIENRKKHRVDEFALDATGLERTLKDGDLLKISPISAQFENAVTIRGNVASPGRFPWHEGMRVSDLIPSREGLVTNEHWNQQNHLSDDRHTDMMTDIIQTNAEINWDYAAIERLDEHDLSTRLIPFNLGNAIDNPASSDNQALKVGDIITIFSRKDLPLPLEKHQTIVQIGGEVNAPGVYRVKPGETLRDLVEHAGGLTPHSYLYASQLTRASAKAVQQQILDIEISRIERELTASYASKNSIAASSSSGGANGIASEDAAKMGMQQALLAKLADVHATGRVVLGLKPDAKTIQDIPDFPLEDGDSFFVPATLATVNVIGEVYNANTFRYQSKKRLSEYLDDTGGATRMADVKRAFLIRADGTVVSRQTHIGYWSGNFENIALMPGDAIIVPPKLKAPGGFLESLPAITQIISQTAMTGAMISLVQ
jgi:protein involved in polysaccharide export with SLBB domain